MALLAEHKRKVKYGLDPQNTSWSNDTSKFGQRLMEKMGWEKGKGLGANENGITEHIKAGCKSDTRGLGCTPQTADAWIAHQDDFNDLLKMLNSQNEAGNQEEKTEKAKYVDGHKRYYGRFARGQVKTLRSTEDLDCIFGRRKTKSKKAEPKEQSEANSSGSDTEEQIKDGLTTTTSTSSVQEYFAKKMVEMKARKEAKLEEKNIIVDGNSSDERGTDTIDCKDKKEKIASPYSAVNFFYNNDEKESSTCDKETDNERPSRSWYQNFTEDNCSDIHKSSKKKKRKKEKVSNEDMDIEIKTSSKKAKMADKHKTLEDSLSSLRTVSESLELPPVSSGEENKFSKKKKKKEKKIDLKSASDSLICTTGSEEESERKRKRKSKKRRQSEEIIVEDNLDVNALLTLGISENNKNCGNSDTIKAKKTRSRKEQVIDNAATESDKVQKKGKKYTDSTGVISESDQQKKKNKKRKRNHSQTGSDEERGSTACILGSSNDCEVKSKKTKKRTKDKYANESEEDKIKHANEAQNNENVAGEHEINKEETGNKSIADIATRAPPKMSMSERKFKKKQKKKQKEIRKAEQDAKSNTMFPGSNIADIVGYGFDVTARKSARKNNR